jgi:hypothetical protein
MGISLNSNDAFTITDGNGNVRFAIGDKMPHIIGNITGTLEIPKIFKDGVNPDSQNIDREDILATYGELNGIYSNDSADSFIMPFYSISGGYSDTGGKIVSGTGTTVIRRIEQATSKEYLGSSLLDWVEKNGELTLICSQHLARSGYANIIGDDSVYLSFRIYYGRFK